MEENRRWIVEEENKKEERRGAVGGSYVHMISAICRDTSTIDFSEGLYVVGHGYSKNGDR
jgi:hypothetical protein